MALKQTVTTAIYGTDAELSAGNPILLKGQFGISTDSNTVKRGDGSTSYNSLSGIGGGLSSTLTSGYVFVGNGSNVATGVAITGDITITNAGVTSIGSSKVTNTMLAGSIAYSKLSLTGAILNADLAGSIADGKLASSYVYADGTRALTANWNAGAFSATFNSVIVGGSANQIAGSSSASGTLLLKSTTHATKGFTSIGATTMLTVDETNSRVGVGNATPAVLLDVKGTGGGATGSIAQFGDGTAKGGFYTATPGSIGALCFGFGTATNHRLIFTTSNGAPQMVLSTSGQLGIGNFEPSAMLHLPAGTATTGTAPLKFTSGTNLTTAVAGAWEYNGTNFFCTRAGAVRECNLSSSAVTTETLVSDTSVTVNINGTTYKLLAKA